MAPLPTVASMWIGDDLTFLEQLCLKSFVDAGHPTKLYLYDAVGGVPDGVEIADASAVMPVDEFIVNRNSGKAGPHSDRFRYLLLKGTDEIWVDTDAYCVRPFPEAEYMFASHFRHLLANGVLRLPKDSPTLAGLLEFTSTSYPDIPDGFPGIQGKTLRAYKEGVASGNKLHVSDMEWETWGPFALTHFANLHDEAKFAMDRKTLYPLYGGEIFRTLQKPFRAKIEIPDEAISIHFYGSKIRRLLQDKWGGVPQPKSLLGRLCAKHGIDPHDAPVPLADAA